MNAGIDGTNASLDRFDADMNAGIDGYERPHRHASTPASTRSEADIDRLFVLASTLQEHGRRLDAIERQLADDPAPPGSRVTP